MSRVIILGDDEKLAKLTISRFASRIGIVGALPYVAKEVAIRRFPSGMGRGAGPKSSSGQARQCKIRDRSLDPDCESCGWWQNRWSGCDQCAREGSGRADSATIWRDIIRKLMRRGERLRGGPALHVGGLRKAIRMEMTERENEVNDQRKQRQHRAVTCVRSYAPHVAHLITRRQRPDLCRRSLISQRGEDCERLPAVVHAYLVDHCLTVLYDANNSEPVCL
jgi:hypothetical protein